MPARSAKVTHKSKRNRDTRSLYTFRFMARRHVTRQSGTDVREHPTYSLREAARYVHVPESTLKSWVLGRPYPTQSGVRRFKPLIHAADPKRKLLSFYNIAEAHVLAATHGRNIPLKNVRRAMGFVERSMPNSKHPLLSYDFATKGSHLFVEHLGIAMDATAQGQQVMEMLQKLLLKITKRGPDGYPIEIEPRNTTVLIINPEVCSGRPVLRGRGIPVSVLWERKEARQPIQKIAKDFGLSEPEVERALEEFAAA